MVNNGLVTSLILIGAVALGATLPPSIASAFTQKGFATEIGDVVPIGHEWITRLSALELLGGDTIIKPDPNDPRKTWTAGKAKNTDLSSAGARREADRIRNLKHNNRYYAAVYEFVYASIVGERWVDIVPIPQHTWSVETSPDGATYSRQIRWAGWVQVTWSLNSDAISSARTAE